MNNNQKNVDLFELSIKTFNEIALRKAYYLDLVNYNSSIYKPVLDIGEVENIFRPEHGYSCPDSSFELSSIIKNYELARLKLYSYKINRSKLDQLKEASVGLACGCTGVAFNIFMSISKYIKNYFAKHVNTPEVIIPLPTYPLYDSLARLCKIKTRYVKTSEKDAYLPTFDKIADCCNNNTIAIILIYPTNPCQTTYSSASIKELESLIRFCQEQEIFLIIDNIYQDTLWRKELEQIEIFSLADNLRFLVKIFGPSKDRPQMAGLRLGYYIGDPRLAKKFSYLSSLTINSQNTNAKCLFALDLLFRRKIIEGANLNEEDMAELDTYLIGWNRRINKEYLFDIIQEKKIFEKYKATLKTNNKLLAKTLFDIIEFLRSSIIIDKTTNQGIGNVILVKLKDNYFAGNSYDFYNYLLSEIGLGVTPGNCFGIFEKKEIWFRISTIQDEKRKIIQALNKLEKAVIKNAKIHISLK